MNKNNEKYDSDLAERLKTEKPAELAPSPILSAERVKNNSIPVIVLAVVAAISIAANVYVIATLIYKNSTISQLETDVEKKKETIQNLRIRLNDVEE